MSTVAPLNISLCTPSCPVQGYSMDCACLEWTKVCQMNHAKYMQEIKDNLYLGDQMSPEAEIIAAFLAKQAEPAPAVQEPAAAVQEPAQEPLCFCGKRAEGDYCSMRCYAQSKREEEEYYDAQDAFYAQRRALHLQTCTADCIVGICTCPGAAQLAWTAAADLGVTTGAPWAADAAAGLANLVLQAEPPRAVTARVLSRAYESEELVNENPFAGAAAEAQPEPQTPPIKGKEKMCYLCREEFFGLDRVCPDCAKTEISIECDSCHHTLMISPAYTGERLCMTCKDYGRHAKFFCLSCEESPRGECVDCYMAANQYDGNRLRMPDTLWRMRQAFYMEEDYYRRSRQ